MKKKETAQTHFGMNKCWTKASIWAMHQAIQSWWCSHMHQSSNKTRTLKMEPLKQNKNLKWMDENRYQSAHIKHYQKKNIQPLMYLSYKTCNNNMHFSFRINCSLLILNLYGINSHRMFDFSSQLYLYHWFE